MRVRADWAREALVPSTAQSWIPSPQPGVERVLLDRIGDEVAVATSLVRYAPGSNFPQHLHGGGEEFVVLEGTFVDEHGSYPAGTYVRNPPGTAHAPSSPDGCTIFVKLRQFQEGDDTPCVIDLNALDAGSHVLHRYGQECVELTTLVAGATLEVAAGGVPRELLLLSGRLELDDEVLLPWSWLRVPPGEVRRLTVVEDARCFLKDRPLPE